MQWNYFTRIIARKRMIRVRRSYEIMQMTIIGVSYWKFILSVIHRIAVPTWISQEKILFEDWKYITSFEKSIYKKYHKKKKDKYSLLMRIYSIWFLVKFLFLKILTLCFRIKAKCLFHSIKLKIKSIIHIIFFK